MLPTKLRPAFILSVIIVILATVTSLGGLFITDLYRDNNFVESLWKPNDLVTLVVAVPMLVTALILSRRGSQRAQLVWMAMLDYTLYNYAFYLFAAAFNWFFLLYVALFALSIYALIFGLVNIDANRISQNFREGTPVKWISGYMLFVAVGLTTIYITKSLGFIATGQLPEIIVKTGHPTSVVFALDLSLLIPVFVIGAIWLWRRQPWGYVLATISIVKGTTYTLVLTVVALWSGIDGAPGAMSEIPLWFVLTIAGLVASLLLLGNLNQYSSQPSTSRSRNFQG
jgi:hypothetical protein